MNIKNAINHFKTICAHKKWVFYYCCKAGIPWRGIKHDMSKFSPTEFFESIKFYSGNDSPINACKKANGYSKSWQHHKGRNTHHYEYWTDNYDNGTTYIKMPFNDAVELICDHFGASRVYLKDKFSFDKEYSWWKAKREKCAMNEHTKRFIDLVYEAIDRENGNILKILNKYSLRIIYNISNLNKGGIIMKHELKCLSCKNSVADPETGYYCPILNDCKDMNFKFYEQEKNNMKVFLGGTCEGRDWRSELIPKLTCDYFNPVVENWTEACKKIERRERDTADAVLYVITTDMKGVYSIAEVIDDSNKRPEKTIFCVLDIDKFDNKMKSSLEEVKNMVTRNKSYVFSNLDKVAAFLNAMDV